MKNTVKKRDPIKEIDVNFLNQIVMTLEQAEIKMEQSFRRKKNEQFNAAKQFILKLNKKISEELNGKTGL
jgi:hypothetical protein